MNEDRSSRYMIVWAGTSPGKHGRERQRGVARTRAMRKIVGPALVLAGLGAAAGASAVHSAGDWGHATAHPVADSPAAQPNVPWMY